MIRYLTALTRWFRKLSPIYKIIILVSIFFSVIGAMAIANDIVFDSIRDINLQTNDDSDGGLPAFGFLLLPTTITVGVLTWLKKKKRKKKI